MFPLDGRSRWSHAGKSREFPASERIRTHVFPDAIDTPAWQALAQHHRSVAERHMRDLFRHDPGRGKRFSKPVLATPEAMEGIRADPALRSLIVQGREQTIACALSLLNGPEQGIGELARQCVLRDYTWKENLKRITQLLEGTC